MKQTQIEEEIIVNQIKAAREDQDFQLYLRVAYEDAERKTLLADDSIIATLHHAFSAGVAVGGILAKRPHQVTPKIMRTRH